MLYSAICALVENVDGLKLMTSLIQKQMTSSLSDITKEMNNFKVSKDIELKEFMVKSRQTTDSLKKSVTKETMLLDMKLSVVKKIADNLREPLDQCMERMNVID